MAFRPPLYSDFNYNYSSICTNLYLWRTLQFQRLPQLGKKCLVLSNFSDQIYCQLHLSVAVAAAAAVEIRDEPSHCSGDSMWEQGNHEKLGNN